MTHRYVFGIDPGKTTGYAILNIKHGEFETTGQKEQQEFCTLAESWLERFASSTLVVCESFIITMATAKNSQAPWSLEIIGAVRYLCGKYDADFELQSPADAKRFSTNDKLKAIGWYTPAMRHQNDAVRHILLAAAKKGIVSPHDLI